MKRPFHMATIAAAFLSLSPVGSLAQSTEALEAEAARLTNALVDQLGGYQQLGNEAAELAGTYAAKGFSPARIERQMTNAEGHSWLPTVTTDQLVTLAENEAVAHAEQRLQMRLDQCKSGTESEGVFQLIATAAGADQAGTFKQARADFCKAVAVYLQLKEMQAQYQFYEANGYTIIQRSKSDRLSVSVGASTFRRTVQAQMRLAWYPNAQATYNDGLSLQDRLSFSADWKWSDDPWQQLGSQLKALAESTGGGDKICIPVSDVIKLCFNTSDVTLESVKVHLWVKAHFKAHDRSMDLGTYTVPAPFGYLDQVAQMKDNWVQDMVSKLESNIASMLHVDPQIVQTAAQLSAVAAQAAMAQEAAGSSDTSGASGN